MKVSHKEQGLALLMLVFLLAFTVVIYTINAIDTNSINQKRNQKTSEALAEAKAALLGEVVRVEEAELGAKITEAIYLPNPDIAGGLGEGIEAGNLGGQNRVVLGKLPWRDLDFHAIKDGWGECLWYVVSGSYKRNPPTDSIYNWDRQGQIDIIDANATYVANNIVALIVAPGAILEGQNRTLGDAGYLQCGGNYDARNYLDTFNNVDAIIGNVNYFPGSTDNRAASNTNDKTFVLASNNNYNDKFIIITVDDIFNLLVKRSDFITEMNSQIDGAVSDINAAGLVATGSKGTSGIDCSASSNPTFCQNWKEMFLLANVNTGVTVNGLPCNKVLIFGGKRTATQARITNDDKSKPENYLEGDNLDAFNKVTGINFVGPEIFDGNNPSADVVRCVS